MTLTKQFLLIDKEINPKPRLITFKHKFRNWQPERSSASGNGCRMARLDDYLRVDNKPNVLQAEGEMDNLNGE